MFHQCTFTDTTSKASNTLVHQGGLKRFNDESAFSEEKMDNFSHSAKQPRLEIQEDAGDSSVE